MANVTITATITQPVENIEAFADAIGYFEVVEDPNDPNQTIPNPESKQDFVKRVFLEHSVTWFTKVGVTAIQQAKMDEAESEAEAYRQTIRDTITIN